MLSQNLRPLGAAQTMWFQVWVYLLLFHNQRTALQLYQLLLLNLLHTSATIDAQSQNLGCDLYWSFWPNWLFEKIRDGNSPKSGGHLITEVHISLENRRYTQISFACTVDSRYLAPVGSQNLRARVKWFSRGHNSRLPGSQTHIPAYMTYSGVYKSQNSMLSDNKVTYVSRISTHIDLTPATNHNKQH